MPTSDDSVTAVELVDPLVGTIFDKRFRVDERIAAGGFGAIYRATHVKSGHQIALKVLHPTLASDLGVLARFRREGTTLTSLRNPHTITAYEFGQVDKTLFIVLELLHGESLFERYSLNGPMEWKRVVHMAKQVCESLEEAHAQGIVHRDLKPTNIHLEEQEGDPDYVKVLDFGIAKILRGSSEHESQDITNVGQMIGTLDYMSPEQMVGGQVTGQTDIYTLGILMYEMIAGTRPFPESTTATGALAAMLKTTPEALYLRAPVPRELDTIVMRCLERETQRRYRTVGELRAALERVVSDAVSATTATVLLPAPKPGFDDNDETTVTPPPEKILDALRTAKPGTKAQAENVDASKLESRHTPRLDAMNTPKLEPRHAPRLDAMNTPRLESRHTPKLESRHAPSLDAMNTPRLERTPALSEWEDDDEVAPTTTRHPDGQDAMPSAAPSAASTRPAPSTAPHTPAPSTAPSRPASRTGAPPLRPSPMPQSPPLRPLESRHIPTPVPQIVVAPFSPTRTPLPTDPRMRPPTAQILADQRPRTPTGPPPAYQPQGDPTPGGQMPGAMPGGQTHGGGPGSSMPGDHRLGTTVGVPPPPSGLAQPGPFPVTISGPGSHAAPTSPPIYGAPYPSAPPSLLPNTPPTGKYDPARPPLLPNTPPTGKYDPGRPPTAGYDMGKMAARETTIRQLIWIIVLAVAAGLGFIFATQL